MQVSAASEAVAAAALAVAAYGIPLERSAEAAELVRSGAVPAGSEGRQLAGAGFARVGDVRGRSVEIELVALDVLHHQARLVVAIGRQ